MANPYRPPEIPPNANLPEAPHRVTPIARQPGFWLPIIIAIAIVVCLSYYYRGQTMGPSMRAADAVTTSRPKLQLEQATGHQRRHNQLRFAGSVSRARWTRLPKVPSRPFSVTYPSKIRAVSLPLMLSQFREPEGPPDGDVHGPARQALPRHHFTWYLRALREQRHHCGQVA